jgi:hypothetical protein
MRGNAIVAGLLALGLVATVGSAAEPPGLLNYQGVLRDDADDAIDGTRDMVLRLYDTAGDAFCNGGTLLLTDSHEAAGTGAVEITNGLFDLHIGGGSITPGTEGTLAEVFRDHAAAYLEVTVQGEKLCPRIRVVSAGYSLNADHLDGADSAYFLNTSAATQTKSGTLSIGGSLAVSGSLYDPVGPQVVISDDLYVSGGDMDLGPGASDDLSASDVTVLTSGGTADALHAHASTGNASTLDGLDSSQFLRSDTSDSFTSGTLTLNGGTTLEVAGTLRGNSLVDRNNTSYHVDPSGSSNLNTVYANAFYDLANSTYYLDPGDTGVSGYLYSDFALGYGSPSDNDYLYFDQNAESLQWQDSAGSFIFSDDVYTASGMTAAAFYDASSTTYYVDPGNTSTSARLGGGISIGYGSAADNDTLYFDQNAEWLNWENANTRFAFSDDLYTPYGVTAGAFYGSSGTTYYVDPDNSATSARLSGDLYLGQGSATDDDTIYLNAGASWFRWDEAGDEFELNNDLYISGAAYGVEAYGSTGGGYFKDSNQSGYAIVGYIDRGIVAHGSMGGGYFSDLDGTSYAELAYESYGILAEGDVMGAEFGHPTASGHARLAHFNTGVWGRGSLRGGAFYDDDHTGAAEVGTGDTGISAEGNYQGGYFLDLTSSNYVRAGYGSYKAYGVGTNSFVQNHPLNEDEVIVYASPEGDEVATYTRGTARLTGGEARVSLGDTFQWVTNPDIGLTAHLTPHGDCLGLYIESLGTEEMIVRELGGGTSDVVFDYLVFGLRIGFEESSIVQMKTEESYIPSMEDHRALYEQAPELRRYNALERFKTMHADAGFAVESLDFTASTTLRDAIEEYDPEAHGPVGRVRHEVEPQSRVLDDERDPTRGLEVQPDADEAEDPPGIAGTTAGIEGTPISVDEDGNVYGKSFRPSASDLASLATVTERVEAGDVLVIDPDRPGAMSLARMAADSAVFGIVAAEPGVVLGARPPETVEDGSDGEPGAGEFQEEASGTAEIAGPSKVPVALSGVALCKVDAGYGSILPGDLLSTSPTAGYAMRTDDPRPGTILGKALQPLDTGTGLIKVLVMLR